MTSLSVLAELHVREFVSRQKHQDALNQEECKRLGLKDCGKGKTKRNGDWRQYAINCAGPLCLLDAVGQAEESWVELFEHAPRCNLPEAKPKMNGKTSLHRTLDGELTRDDNLKLA
jgi:hypothetical protein